VTLLIDPRWRLGGGRACGGAALQEGQEGQRGLRVRAYNHGARGQLTVQALVSSRAARLCPSLFPSSYSSESRVRVCVTVSLSLHFHAGERCMVDGSCTLWPSSVAPDWFS